MSSPAAAALPWMRVPKSIQPGMGVPLTAVPDMDPRLQRALLNNCASTVLHPCHVRVPEKALIPCPNYLTCITRHQGVHGALSCTIRGVGGDERRAEHST